MFTWTAWYKSNTMRALLVALVAWLLNTFGVEEATANSQAATIAGHALSVVEGLAILWGMWARAKLPSPRLTLTKQHAERRNAVAEAAAAVK